MWNVNYSSIVIGKVREYLESQYSNMDDAIDCEQILALTSAAGVGDLPQVIDYNARRQAEVKVLIADIKQGVLRHHTIHCLSVTASLSNVTGMSIEKFGLLFADLLPDLWAK
jgi:hypothetical protein